MKGFNKLALVAAVAALPAAGFAMQPLEDEELSDVTGQDGISISANVDMDVDLGWEDTSGLGFAAGVPAPGDRAGMVYMPGFTIAGQIDIDLDAGADANGVGGGVLQVGVSIPTITVSNFDIFVRGTGLDNPDENATFAAEQRDAVTGNGRFAAVAADAGDAVISLGTITLDAMDLTLQFGADATNLAVINTTGTIDISVSNVVVYDRSSTGSITIDDLAITDVDIDGTTVAATATGLSIVMPATASQNVSMMGLGLGDGTGTTVSSIGNIYSGITNNAATTLTITGR